MANLFSITGFVEAIQNGIRAHSHHTETAVKDAAVEIQRRAREKLGTYQPGWPELADGTKKQRVALGWSENDPLLRSGELANSIGYRVHWSWRGWDAAVGVPDVMIGDGSKENPMRSAATVAMVMELGSPRHNVPARPFLGPTGAELAPQLAHQIARKVVAGLFPLR